ncbi:MAG: hypothetical protein LBO74_11510 [Candidatus Symbiothrix sp.]|jgi:hypothetical protein|nr:hypothetical protein [Candidatus Symbiothrix sp.]
MKNTLNSTFGIDKFNHIDIESNELHVVDYTERTNSKRAVEVFCIKPSKIDSLKISNPTKFPITTSIFKSQCFMGNDGKELKQCECILYPTTYTKDSLVLFIEIKDCKAKNIATHYDNIKEKFIVNVKLFRDKGVLEDDKIVYAVASFPRSNKTVFHNQFITPPDIKDFRDNHKMIVMGTNNITIKDEKSIL